MFESISRAACAILGFIDQHTPFFTALAALSAAIYAFVFWRSIRWIKAQLQEQKRLTQANILTDIYKLVRESRQSREMLFQNRRSLWKVGDKKNFVRFRACDKDLYRAFKEVTACYQYIGFLIKEKILDSDLFLREGYTSVYRVNAVVAHLIKFEREEMNNNDDYKEEFLFLMELARKKYQAKPGFKEPFEDRPSDAWLKIYDDK